MTEPDRRPRPQYGEYASPEEQKASIRVPAEHAADEPVPIARVVPVTHEQSAVPDRLASAAQTAGLPQTPARSGDRIFTLALLTLGFLNVVFTVPGLFDLSSTINATFKQMGVGTFTPTSLAQVLGIGLAVFYVVAWIGTLLLTLPRLRAGRLSFWIPLVAGVVVTVVSMICFLILFLGDPSFVAYMTKNV